MFGLALAGFGTILGAVNFITTIITMRAPGMTMFRMPIFTWNILVTSILVLLAFPVLAAGLFALGADRVFGAHLLDPANGGAMLWQHLFWFFGHPEVYIIALPFFGIISEVLPVFSRKPIFGYKTLIYATIAIAALSVTVWAHHMYVTGSVLLPFFALLTMLIAVPTGVKIFNWIGTMWRGSVTFETPMLWAIGFLITFTFGGLTGVILASPPLDFHVSDTYFVVAHFHYVVFGTVVFAMFSGFYFWWPKWTGKMLNESLGKWHFWLLFIGFHTTFLIQHWIGVVGMPRRYWSYLPTDNVTWMNQISTVGAAILAISMLPFLLNVWITHRRGVEGHRRRPVGQRALARVGDLVPAAAPQLHVDPAHPLGVAGVRPPPPRGRRAGRHRPAEGRTRHARSSTWPHGRGEVACASTRTCSGSSPRSSGLADALYIGWNLISYYTATATRTRTTGRVGRHGRRSASPASWRASSRSTSGATRRAQGGELPEDRDDANIDDGDPEIGLLQPVELVADDAGASASR